MCSRIKFLFLLRLALLFFLVGRGKEALLAADPPANATPAAKPASPYSEQEQKQLTFAANLEAQSQKLKNEGKWKEAIAAGNYALNLRKNIQGEDHLETIASFRNVGMIHRASSNYAAARPYFEDALRFRRDAQGDDHADIAEAQNDLGFVLEMLRDYARAKTCYEQALRIHRKVLGDEHATTLNTLDYLGSANQGLGDFAAAQANFEETLKTRTKVSGAESEPTVISLMYLGSLLRTQKKYAEAKPYFENALQIRKKLHGEMHIYTAMSLNSMAFLLQLQNDLPGARNYYEQAFKVYNQVQGPNHLETAVAAANLAYLLELQREYAAAQTYYTLALNIRRKSLGDEHPYTLGSLRSAASNLRAQGKFAEAKTHFDHLLTILRKTLGPEHPDTVGVINQLGQLTFLQRDYDASLTYYQEALTIRKKLYGFEHPDTILSFANIGAVLQNQGDYASSRFYHEQALKYGKKVNGEEHPETLVALNNMGTVSFSLGDYVAARQYYEQTLAIRKKVFGSEHPETAVSLMNLGTLLIEQGKLSEARPYFEQCHAIRKKVLGSEHFDTALSQLQIGSLYSNEGDYGAARREFEQALAVFRKVVGDSHPQTAGALTCLLNVHLDTSNLGDARTCAEQALEIRQKAFGEKHLETALSLHNLGRVFNDQGDYAKARQYFERALEIRKKILGDEHPYVAQTMSALALVYYAQKDFEGCRKLNERALAIRTKAHGEDHLSVGESLNNLAMLFRSQGNDGAARTYYEKSVKINEKVYGKDHPITAIAKNNLAYCLFSQGNYPDAGPYFEEALAVRTKLLGDEHPDTISTRFSLAYLDMALGDTEHAAELVDQGRRGIRRYIGRVLPTLSEKEQLMFVQKVDQGQLNITYSVALECKSDPKICELSAGWLLNTKGIGQAALAERALMTRDLEDPKLTLLVNQLSETRRQLATMTMSVPKPSQEATRKESLAKLVAEEERIARQITASNGRATSSDPWVEVSQIRESIPEDTVLISISRINVFDFLTRGRNNPYRPARYAAWIIPTKNKGAIHVADLGVAAEIDAAVEEARKAIQQATEIRGLVKSEGEPAGEKETREKLKKLTDMVWKPVAEKIGSVQKLVISPDGALWLLPWGALPINDDKVLLEDYSIRYVVSGREVIPARATTLTTSPPTLFSDPDFDLSPENMREAMKAVLPNQKPITDAMARRKMNKTTLPQVARLPHTATEAQVISPNIAKVAKGELQSYTDRYALESVLKNVQRPSMLVLSTHGFFLSNSEGTNSGVAPLAAPSSSQPNSTQVAATETRSSAPTSDPNVIENPLLRCGLLLAGCNAQQSAGSDDGVLTGMEILNMDLRGTDMVVLSACETGVGTVRNGEGVAGLRQAFQLAGAKGVVASLWQVPDRDSMLIMNDFFQNMADGQTKTDALRNAQLKRIASRREKNGAAHPFFWAAWTLTGQ